ncbi:MAG: hypothetical protein OXT09_34710 [Myxococcales bacterium]|nr:hypothetical protein [Myxococcales bacterium]
MQSMDSGSTRPARLVGLGAAAGAAAYAASVASASAQEEDAAAERSQAFQAVQGAVEEDVPGGPLMVAAYAVVLTAMVLYVLRIARLQRRMGADLARLEGALKQQARSDGGDG